VRLSQFNELMIDEFGREYAAVIARDLVLGALLDKTADQAMAEGVDPREIWLAICEAAGVPKSRWHGASKDKKFKPNK
jgi:hypothetical protein